jgi:hypothetical protein
LVREEEYRIKAASKLINSVKKNEVPRMTLSDRLKRPGENPPLSRPQELSRDVEEALVQCLEMCAEFQYPLKKRDLQDLVQSYRITNSVKKRPGGRTIGQGTTGSGASRSGGVTG